MIDRQNAGDHAERAVVFAGVDHGVDVRADQQPPALAEAAAHGAERVLAHRHAGVAHPFRDEIGGAAMLGRQKQPHQPVRLGRDRAELGEHRLGARAERLRVERAHFEPFTQRPSVSRSSSVMPVWLPSGIARFCTVCARISLAQRRISGTVSSVTFFGGSLNAGCAGSLAWHVDAVLLRDRQRLGSR